MSNVSLSFYKARQGLPDVGLTWVDSTTNPVVMGYNQSSFWDQGALYRMPISVTAGYQVTGLTFNIGNIASNKSRETIKVYALIYADDPWRAFGTEAPAPLVSGSTEVRIEGWEGTSSIIVNVSLQSPITESKEYYMFLTTNATNSLDPFMKDVRNISCSPSEIKPETPATSVNVSTTPYMDQDFYISWSPYTSGYTYTVMYSFVNHNTLHTVVERTTSNSANCNAPSDVYGPDIPNSTSGSFKIYVTSYNSSGTQVGETSAEFTLSLPLPIESRNPTCTDGWASASYTAVASNCVAGYSDIQVTVDIGLISCKYGATLKQVNINCNSYSGITKTSGTFNCGKAIAGNNIITVTAYDSRGLFTTYIYTIVGKEYSPPSFNSLSVIRCDSSGNASPSGTYYAVIPSVAYTSYNNANSLTIKTRWQVFGGSYSSYTNINNGVQSAAQGGGNIATTSSYLIEVVAVDSIGQSSTQTRTLTNTSVAATLNLKSNGLGAAFFGLSSIDKELTVFGRVGVTPTIDDVKFDTGNYDGAMLISVGGKDRGGGNGIYKGNGDGLSMGANGICNIAIKSWNGIGFVDGCSGTGIAAGIDCRNGDVYARRDVRAGSCVYANRLQLANAGGNGIWRDGSGTSWFDGRDGALLRNGTNTNAWAFWPITSCKAPSGTWDVGVQGDNYCFVYNSDANYDTKDNEHSPVILMSKEGSLNTPGWITTVGINIGAGGLVLADIGANAGTAEPSGWSSGKLYFQYS